MSNAGVFIKHKNPDSININEIVTQLFGEIQSINNEWYNEFDIRNSNSLVVSVYENGISIQSSNYVNKILVQRDKNEILKLMEVFDKPEIILAYMHYDSGDSFGFCYIENGYIRRFRYSTSIDFITCEFGLPLDEELPVLNKEIYYKVDEDGERTYLYKSIDNPKMSKQLHFINSELASVVMQNKIGYGISENMGGEEEYYITLRI